MKSFSTQHVIVASAYGEFKITKQTNNGASGDTEYYEVTHPQARDPLTITLNKNDGSYQFSPIAEVDEVIYAKLYLQINQTVYIVPEEPAE